MTDDTLTSSSDITKQVEDVLRVTKVIPLHTHNGVDTLQIQQSSIVNGTTVQASGSSALTGNVILAGGSNITVTESGQTITIAETVTPTIFNVFGDGSDGVAVFDGNATPAGTTKLASAYTLTRDVYYTTVVFSGSATLETAGYQGFANISTTIGSGSKIFRAPNNGGAGGNGFGSTGGTPAGTAGAALSGATVPGALAGIAGVTGAGGTSFGIGGLGTGGLTATAANPSIGSAGAAGVAGGAGGVGSSKAGGAGGSGASGGTKTTALNTPDSLTGSLIHADLTSSYAQHQGSATQGGGGSGGAGGAEGNGRDSGGGGASGGGGSCGGVVAWYSKSIVNNATGGIQALGGNGGNGGNGGGSTGGGGDAGGGGGGAGGAGGTGGVLVLVYSSLTQNGSFLVTGGSGGTGGTGGTFFGNSQPGSNGSAGNTGATGIIWSYQT